MRRVRDLALVALAAVAAAAAACTPAANTDSAETMRVWLEKDRRNCSETGGRWQEAAAVCWRGGP